MIKANYNEIELRNQIVNLALLQHKKLYEYGKHGLDAFDCAGLVWYIYNTILNIDLYSKGYGLSTTTMLMTSKYGKLTLFQEADKIKNLNLIKNGDIIFLHTQSLKDNAPLSNNKYPGHCGIYLGEEKFIHASKPKQCVVISDFTKNDYWLKVLVGSKNIFEENKEKNITLQKIFK